MINRMQERGKIVNMEERTVMPCIPLRGLLIFPNTVLHFDVGREKSIKALEAAMNNDKILFVSSQKDENILIPTQEDYYKVGTVIKIKQMLKIQGDTVRVLVEGLYRACIREVVSEEPYITVDVDEIKSINYPAEETETQAMIRVMLDNFEEYKSLKPNFKADLYDLSVIMDNADMLTDTIAIQLNIDVAQKQKILETADVKERMILLSSLIFEENQILNLERKLSIQVEENVKQNQKEYYLREQMKAIQSELGFGEDAVAEADEWMQKLKELKLDSKIEEKISKEIDKFTKMSPASAESGVVRNYVETVLSLPWNKSSRISSDINKAEKILNEDHYGLSKVKDRILEYLAVIHLSKAIKGPIICLVGPPGVGKTSIAKSIARATGREFVRMALGGVRDEAEIRGHRRTYIGAMPGRIIHGMQTSGCMNPVFLLDEIDKMASDFRGDPASALLEVLDPEQNNTFSDHYIEFPFDLSHVFWIVTANTVETIPPALLDRMEVIQLTSYTEDEKVKIGELHLLPKERQAHGLTAKTLNITETALRHVIREYTREAGVRNLERKIAAICRKTAHRIVTKQVKSAKVTEKNLTKYLGPVIFLESDLTAKAEIGICTGLAWTSVGGELLKVEVLATNGKGGLVLTGQLGDVMKESAQAGYTYIRSRAKELHLDEKFYETTDIHIHLPEGWSFCRHYYGDSYGFCTD